MRSVLLGFIIIFVVSPSCWAEAPAVKIGLITPLTGSRASIGEDAVQGARLALADLEKEGKFGKGRLDLVVEDSQGDPAKGVSAYRKLVSEGVKLVITQNSNISLPVSQLVNADGVLQLAVTTTTDRYSTPKDLTFRTNGPTAGEAEAMAAYLAERVKADDGRVALITMQDEYPIALRSHLLDELEKRGIKVSLNEDFLPSDNDFRAILTKVKAKGIKYILLLGYQTQVGIFVKQQKELGAGAALFLTNTPVNNREFFTAAGDAAEGVVLTYPSPRYKHQAAGRFKAKYGKEVSIFSANVYDAVIIAEIAFSKCGFGADMGCLTKALYSIKNFDGLSGTKSFDDVYGDMQDTYELLVARSGKFEALKP